MWTPEGIQAMLAGTGWPVSCGPFPDVPGASVPAPPFIIWDIQGADSYADDANFGRFCELTVELYTPARDFAKERAVEGILQQNGLAWEQDVDWLERQRLHVTTWVLTVAMADGEGGGDGG